MVGKIGGLLSSVQLSVVQSIKKTSTLIDRVQLKLASGKEVNSALDNPSNFFLSRALSQKASDLTRILDGISLGVGAVNAANTGITAILKLIDQADALLDEARAELYAGTLTSLVTSLSNDDITAILAANPGVTYSPATQSFYRLGGPANWATANAIAQSSSLIEPPGVTGVAGVTGHLANITSQQENDFLDALTTSSTWIGGSDATVEGEWRWTSGPESGQQFWQGGAGGSTVSGSYANWGGGEPNNSGGNEDHVHLRADGRWNDQNGGTSFNYLIEWDSSLFVSAADPALVARAESYAREYAVILEQIDQIAKDSQFRGIGLLIGETVKTFFNPEHTSYLTTEGITATSQGLGLVTRDFLKLSTLTLAQEEVFSARQTLRSYLASLSVDMSIISIRLNFTQDTIQVHEDGARDLVVADEKEAGAELLALQVRQQLQTEALRLSFQNYITRLLS
jgi:hypothetical protein